MLIGNKADMNAERTVKREEGMNVAKVRDMQTVCIHNYMGWSYFYGMQDGVGLWIP